MRIAASRRMIQHSCQHRDVTGLRSRLFEQFRSFRTRCAGGQDIVDNQQTLTADDMCIPEAECLTLILKSLSDGHSFLRSCPARAPEQMHIAGNVQLL